MKNTHRIIINAVFIIIGVALVFTGYFFKLDTFWSGLGTGLLVVGVIKLVRGIRYSTDEQYREKVDIEVSDERNRYIGQSAWAWTGYVFVLFGAAVSIVSYILGEQQLSGYASMSICLLIIIYLIAYYILKRKY